VSARLEKFGKQNRGQHILNSDRIFPHKKNCFKIKYKILDSFIKIMMTLQKGLFFGVTLLLRLRVRACVSDLGACVCGCQLRAHKGELLCYVPTD
jgi:hypothetical protein